MIFFSRTQLNNLLFLMSFLVALFSCESEKRELIGADDLPENVSFSVDVIPTFTERCISCHDGSTPPDLTPENAYFDLSSGNYLDVANPPNSNLYKKITGSGSMAPYSKDYQRALILKWIEQGALEN